MRIPSGVTDQYIYFVAVDATDLKTRETGLSSFTVYRSRNGGAAAAMTTPTINETDSTNMPGVYELLLDEDMTIDSGDDSQEMAFHITHTGMAAVTRTIELYRPKITAGNTLDVTSTGAAGIDWGNVENQSTSVDLSATATNLVDTTTTNTDMRGTDNAALASVLGALTDAAADGDPTTTETVMQYAKQLINILVGTAGVVTFPAAAAPGNGVSLAEILRAVYDDTNSLDGTKIPDTLSLANINAEADTALADYDPPTKAELDAGFAALNDPTAAAIADAVWDEAIAGHVAAGSFGEEVQSHALSSEISALNDLSATEVNAEVDTALADIHLDHLLAVDYDPASKPGTATALLNELVEDDGGVSRFTANALEQAPSGGGSADWTSGEREQIRYRLQLDGMQTAPATDDGSQLPVALDDVAHGGTAAMLTLERVVVASTTTNEPGIKATGNGSGSGLHVISGAFAGGVGFRAEGYDNGALIESNNGGHGLNVQGAGNGSAVSLIGAGSGHGLHARGGATDGTAGINATSTATNGDGMQLVGTGTGLDLDATTTDSLEVTVTVNNDKTGYALSAAGIDAILDEPITEPSGVFAWGSATLRNITGWLGALSRNKITQTATTQTLRNDADSADIATSAVSDDGTTATRGEYS